MAGETLRDHCGPRGVGVGAERAGLGDLELTCLRFFQLPVGFDLFSGMKGAKPPGEKGSASSPAPALPQDPPRGSPQGAPPTPQFPSPLEAQWGDSEAGESRGPCSLVQGVRAPLWRRP